MITFFADQPLDLPWISMEEEQPGKEWVYFVGKGEYSPLLRGYALPESECVIMPKIHYSFDNIEYWISLTTVVALTEEGE